MDGQRLAALRSARGLSKEQIAVKAGVTVDAVKKWENKDTIPGTDKFVQIADALGLSLDDLAAKIGLTTRPETAEKSGLPEPWYALFRDAMAAGMTPEDLRAAMEFARHFKGHAAGDQQAHYPYGAPQKRREVL